MKSTETVKSLALAALALFLGDASALAATIVENGKSAYAIVCGDHPRERAAAVDLHDILLRSCSVSLPVATNSFAAALPSGTDKYIFIGDAPGAAERFGACDLAENEYAMMENRGFLGLFGGGDIWFKGGNAEGSMLAVYRFCEDALGYRCFVPEPGCERIVKTDVLETDGRGFRYKASFTSGRGLTHTYLYGDMPRLTRYLFRNGSKCPSRWLKKECVYKDIKPALDLKDQGHGFFLYLTCKRCGLSTYEWDEKIDFFAKHPEWFSMTHSGNRTDRMQLCFSNKDLRKAFTKRVLERCRRVGGEGVLTIGAQDVPGAFCWCKPCRELQEKYATPAGAYWDYLPELCGIVAKEYPAIRIMTLAYRKQQSENFPKGVAKFPDNFICDFAPVDDNQSFPIGGKGNEKSLENMKKWCAACKTVGYWYYACTKHPYGLVTRPVSDIRAAEEGGVDQMKLCGLYAPGFGPMLDYLFLRMALDPAQDPWARVDEFCDFMYGPASGTVKKLARELDRVWTLPTPFVGIDVNATALKCYKAADIVRWQKMLEEASAKIAGNGFAERWFSILRWDIDMLTLQFWRDVRAVKGRPGWLTPETVYERMKKVDHLKRYESRKEKGTKEPTRLYAQAKNVYLTALAIDKPLPAPLDRLPPEQVIQLPQCGGFFGIVDPDAACGHAKSEVYKPGSAIFTNDLVRFDYYNKNTKRMIKTGSFSIKGHTPGKYALYKVADITIPLGAHMTFASWWGIGQSLSNFYPEGDPDRVFECWVSLKFIGPGFGTKTEDGKSRMVCDRMFIVDKSGRKYKGE